MRILLYFLLILLVGCSSGQNKKTHERVDLDSVPVYTNPLLSRGGDPWAVFHNGIYYYTQSMSDRITLWATDDITRLAEASQKDVWVPQNSSNAFHLWGPEIHYINNNGIFIVVRMMEILIIVRFMCLRMSLLAR